MALTATIYRLDIVLSDVERGCYETLVLRIARHPSESMRYLLTRTLAYCLEYREGIAFSKGGISSTDEPPVLVRDATGQLLAWIDIGSPSAERLHKATKAAPEVALYTHTDWVLLRREATSKAIHKVETIRVCRFDPAFLDRLESHIDRNTSLELVRSDGHLYITVGDNTLDSAVDRQSLLA